MFLFDEVQLDPSSERNFVTFFYVSLRQRETLSFSLMFLFDEVQLEPSSERNFVTFFNVSLRQRETLSFSFMFPFDEGQLRSNRNVRLRFLYRQYTNCFILYFNLYLGTVH